METRRGGAHGGGGRDGARGGLARGGWRGEGAVAPGLHELGELIEHLEDAVQGKGDEGVDRAVDHGVRGGVRPLRGRRSTGMRSRGFGRRGLGGMG
jgi:hypothetical protein